MITLAIRFDDPSATSDRSIEQAFMESLARWRLKATLAVIPYREVNGNLVSHDAEGAAHIGAALRAGLVEVALHGHSHRERARTPAGAPSEFWGQEPGTQAALMSDALGKLHALFGRVVSGFVPPWNTFDAATLAAAAQLGLRYVSAGWEGPKGGVLLPRTTWLPYVRRAVAEARTFRSARCVVVAVVHHYDFVESGEPGAMLDRGLLDELFGWISAQADLRVATLAEVARHASAGQTRRAVSLRRVRDRMPWRWRGLVPEESLVLGPPWSLLHRSQAGAASASAT